jgi:hypothetical protein
LFVQEANSQLAQNEYEVCGIASDNLRTQLIGVEEFIPDHDGVSMPVMHVACCNGMINLVFLSSFPMDDLSEMKTNLESIV